MSQRIKQLVFAVLIMVCSAPVLQADLSKAEEREVNNYRFTVDKIGQFGQATKNLAAAFQKNPNLFKGVEGETKRVEGETKYITLAAIIKATDSIPDAKKAIEDAGMTSKEYWTFQMALVYAGTGYMVLKSGQPLPEGFSKENVEFYRIHEAEFMKLDKDLKAIRELTDKESQEEDLEEEEEETEEQK